MPFINAILELSRIILLSPILIFSRVRTVPKYVKLGNVFVIEGVDEIFSYDVEVKVVIGLLLVKFAPAL